MKKHEIFLAVITAAAFIAIIAVGVVVGGAR